MIYVCVCLTIITGIFLNSWRGDYLLVLYVHWGFEHSLCFLSCHSHTHMHMHPYTDIYYIYVHTYIYIYIYIYIDIYILYVYKLIVWRCRLVSSGVSLPYGEKVPL